MPGLRHGFITLRNRLQTRPPHPPPPRQHRGHRGHRASIERGAPLSERKLAAMFGKTSRRWARNRMTEAGQPVVPVLSGKR
jgi:hypothetical protein